MTTNDIMARFGEGDEFSPYKVGKVLGSAIGNVPPQMVYNYIKGERLPARVNNTGKLFLTRDDVEAFVESVLEARAKKAAKAEEAEEEVVA
jgi:hypothetical protein